MAMPTMAAIAKRMTGAANDSKFFSTTKKGALLKAAAREVLCYACREGEL